MAVLEITDAQEAQRCRRAQYSGVPAKITLNGSTICCLVRSVREETPALWIVTIVPKKEKVFLLPRHKPSYS
jgi:hypothetical protein